MKNFETSVVANFPIPNNLLLRFLHSPMPHSTYRSCTKKTINSIWDVGFCFKIVWGCAEILVGPEMHAVAKMAKIHQNCQICQAYLALTNLTKIRQNHQIHEHSLGLKKFVKYAISLLRAFLDISGNLITLIINSFCKL